MSHDKEHTERVLLSLSFSLCCSVVGRSKAGAGVGVCLGGGAGVGVCLGRWAGFPGGPHSAYGFLGPKPHLAYVPELGALGRLVFTPAQVHRS